MPCRSCMTLSASVEPLCSYSLDQFVEGLFQHAMYCDKVDKTSGNLLKNGGGPNGNYEVAGLTDTVRKYVEKTHDVGAVLQAAGGKPTGPCGDFVSARKAPVSSANSRMKTLSTRGDAAASARLAGFVLPPKLSEAEEELAPAPSSRWNKRLLLSRKLREKFAKTRLPTLGGSRESTQEVEDGLDPLDRFETHGGTWVHTVPAHVTLDSTNLQLLADLQMGVGSEPLSVVGTTSVVVEDSPAISPSDAEVDRQDEKRDCVRAAALVIAKLSSSATPRPELPFDETGIVWGENRNAPQEDPTINSGGFRATCSLDGAKKHLRSSRESQSKEEIPCKTFRDDQRSCVVEDHLRSPGSGGAGCFVPQLRLRDGGRSLTRSKDERSSPTTDDHIRPEARHDIARRFAALRHRNHGRESRTESQVAESAKRLEMREQATLNCIMASVEAIPGNFWVQSTARSHLLSEPVQHDLQAFKEGEKVVDTEVVLPAPGLLTRLMKMVVEGSHEAVPGDDEEGDSERPVGAGDPAPATSGPLAVDKAIETVEKKRKVLMIEKVVLEGEQRGIAAGA